MAKVASDKNHLCAIATFRVGRKFFGKRNDEHMVSTRINSER